jgi:hypothetical protein
LPSSRRRFSPALHRAPMRRAAPWPWTPSAPGIA